jgi:hypothetical protein
MTGLSHRKSYELRASLLVSGGMAANDRQTKSPLVQGLIFFVVFVIIAVGLQLILGNSLTGAVVVTQVITAAVAAVIFTLLFRWYQRRS